MIAIRDVALMMTVALLACTVTLRLTCAAIDAMRKRKRKRAMAMILDYQSAKIAPVTNIGAKKDKIRKGY